MDNDIKELIGGLIVLTIFIAGIQWFLVRFTHWSVALLVTCLIAIFISLIYVSLSNASPNGGGRAPNVSALIIPGLIILTFLLCSLALVCYLTQSRLPKIAFLPLIIIVVFAIGMFAYNYITNSTLYNTLYSTCDITVLDETGNASVVKFISFRKKTKGLSNEIYVKSKEKPNPVIPRFSDVIIFRKESSGTEVFPFDYSLLKEKNGHRLGFVFWRYQKIVLPIKIVIKPDNIVDLYIENHLVKKYKLNENLSIKNKTEDDY